MLDPESDLSPQPGLEPAKDSGDGWAQRLLARLRGKPSSEPEGTEVAAPTVADPTAAGDPVEVPPAPEPPPAESAPTEASVFPEEETGASGAPGEGLWARLWRWWRQLWQPRKELTEAEIDEFFAETSPAEGEPTEAPPPTPALDPQELLRLQEEVKRLRGKLGEAKRLFTEQKRLSAARSEKLERDLQEARAQADTVRAELRAQESRAEALAEDLNRQRERSEGLQGEVKRLTERVAGKEQELAALQNRSQEELKEVREEASRAQAQVRDLQEALTRATKETQNLQAELAAQEAERRRTREREVEPAPRPTPARPVSPPVEARRASPPSTPVADSKPARAPAARVEAIPKEKERRKSTRLKGRAWVQAELRGTQYPLGNLSSTGAFIRTRHSHEAGTELNLKLVSPYLPEPIAVTAVVRRSERGRGMGVQFLRFEGDGLQRLEQLLARLLVTRILVVDDDENIRRVLTFALKKGNYEVLTAADGSEGLQLALTSEPDLIILDLHMPGLSGLEVCQQIRSSPRLAQVPVLILSATREMAEFRSAQELGAVMFIPKPFQPQKLFNQVQLLLER